MGLDSRQAKSKGKDRDLQNNLIFFQHILIFRTWFGSKLQLILSPNKR